MRNLLIALTACTLLAGCPEEKKDAKKDSAKAAPAASAAATASAKAAGSSDEGGW
jgi:uncharacterized protein YceK